MDDISSASSSHEDEKVITLEGTWDEDISIEEIHEQVLDKLREEIDELKERYRQLTSGVSSSSSSCILGQDMRILRKITSIRLKHDKLITNAKYIFDELQQIKRRGGGGNCTTATPCTRLVWMNHVQDYFRYLSDMFHIDVSLNRISPGLFRSAKITGVETPGTFHKKRRMTIILQKLIEYEKHNKKTTFNTRMKKYSAENLITVPKRFLDPSTGCNHGKGFPNRWLDLFDEEFREYFSRSNDTIYRWYLLFSLLGTEKFSSRFDFHGMCPFCSYPFIVDKAYKSSSGHTENKLSCKECMKEIDWTYFASNAEMKILRNFIHKQVLGDIDTIIKSCCPSMQVVSETHLVEPSSDLNKDESKEEMSSTVRMKKPLFSNKHISLIHNDDTNIATANATETTSTIVTTTTVNEELLGQVTGEDSYTNNEMMSTSNASSSSQKPMRKRGRKKEHDIEKLIHIAREQLKLCPLYSDRPPLSEEDAVNEKQYDAKIRDSAISLTTELKNFQGASVERIPQGVYQSVESYLMRVYRIPSKEDIRKEPLNLKGERVIIIKPITEDNAEEKLTLSRRMVLEALRECGLGKWSSAISHIIANLWWCPYPKVRYEDEENMIIFIIKQREIFERIKDNFARKMNLSIHAAMGKLLTLHGYPFDETDFKIWETQDSKRKQDHIWETCVRHFHIPQ